MLFVSNASTGLLERRKYQVVLSVVLLLHCFSAPLLHSPPSFCSRCMFLHHLRLRRAAIGFQLLWRGYYVRTRYRVKEKVRENESLLNPCFTLPRNKRSYRGRALFFDAGIASLHRKTRKEGASGFVPKQTDSSMAPLLSVDIVREESGLVNAISMSRRLV